LNSLLSANSSEATKLLFPGLGSTFGAKTKRKKKAKNILGGVKDGVQDLSKGVTSGIGALVRIWKISNIIRIAMVDYL
jgi:hypothetical protein